MSALVSPWAGNIGDRLGAKKSMLVGTAVFFIGMVMTAYITELWHFWVTFGVILGIAQAIFSVPLILCLFNSFIHKFPFSINMFISSAVYRVYFLFFFLPSFTFTSLNFIIRLSYTKL